MARFNVLEWNKILVCFFFFWIRCISTSNTFNRHYLWTLKTFYINNVQHGCSVYDRVHLLDGWMNLDGCLKRQHSNKCWTWLVASPMYISRVRIQFTFRYVWVKRCKWKKKRETEWVSEWWNEPKILYGTTYSLSHLSINGWADIVKPAFLHALNDELLQHTRSMHINLAWRHWKYIVKHEKYP